MAEPGTQVNASVTRVRRIFRRLLASQFLNIPSPYSIFATPLSGLGNFTKTAGSCPRRPIKTRPGSSNRAPDARPGLTVDSLLLCNANSQLHQKSLSLTSALAESSDGVVRLTEYLRR